MFNGAWPMLVVLALIAGLAWGARRWLNGMNRATGGAAIDILARQFVSSKQTLCLVRLGRRVVLLGVTPDRMTTLCEISDPEEAALLVASIETRRPQSFTSAMARLTAQDDAGDVDEPAEDGAAVMPVGQLSAASARVRALADRIRDWSSSQPVGGADARAVPTPR
jgi:flagellar biosynthetic protein FliO